MDRVYCRQEESYVRAKLMQYSRRRRRGRRGRRGNEERRSDSRRPNNRRCNDAPVRPRLCMSRDQASSISGSPRRFPDILREIPDRRSADFFGCFGTRARADRAIVSPCEMARNGTNRELTSFDCFRILLISLRTESLRW